MTKDIKIDKTDIASFLGLVGHLMCHEASENRVKVKDMQNHFSTAMALCFMLAKKQPELVDACIQWWDFTQDIKHEEFVKQWLGNYKEFKEVTNDAGD